MHKIILMVLGVVFLLAAGPATRPINSLEDVESNYRDRAAMAKKAYTDEMTMAQGERLAGLKILLSRAMKAEDIDQAMAIKKKIDDIKGGTNQAVGSDANKGTADPDTDPETNTSVTSANTSFFGVDAKGKKIVYLCQKAGNMLSVFGVLKQQLKDSINKLDPTSGQQFNVVFFSDDGADPLFKDNTRLATPENKKLAMNYIDNEVASGGELPLPAIKFALKEKPELLYVLTDFSSIPSYSDVAKAFKQGNPDGKIQINYISLQSDDDPKADQIFSQIANDSHGTFKKISKSGL